MKHRKGLVIFEKLLYVIIGILFIVNILCQSFSMAALSKTNYEKEVIKEKVKTAQNANESIKMKINELTSLDNILKVANKYSLMYRDANIRIIDE